MFIRRTPISARTCGATTLFLQIRKQVRLYSTSAAVLVFFHSISNSLDQTVHSRLTPTSVSSSGASAATMKEICLLQVRFQPLPRADSLSLVNCWPNPNSDGSCDVNVDFELLDKSLTLEGPCFTLQRSDHRATGVSIAIPLPSGTGNPIVSTVTGDYEFNRYGKRLSRITLNTCVQP